MIDMNPMVLSNILNKKSKKIDIDTLDQIANALHINLKELPDSAYISKLENENSYEEQGQYSFYYKDGLTRKVL